MIYLIKDRANEKQILEMLEILGSYVKLAVDIEGVSLQEGALCMQIAKQSY